ncbi:MAG: DUF222 domain-containing protein [Aldersonia sp.]|nr:DUF222 domain-containing protein [Aldersonia sp.]
MDAAGDLITITDRLRELRFDDDLSARGAFEAIRTLLTLGNLVDHHTTTVVGMLDRLGVASAHGRSTRELLIVMGFAPAVAMRLLRLASAAAQVPTLVAHSSDGSISGEHADAIVRGVGHIAARSREPIGDATRYRHVTDLLGQFFSGATPAQIAERSRRLGNEFATATGGLPAAEDRNLNALDHTQDADGRLQVRADLDAEVGEKLQAAIEKLAAPRPEPDGSPDTRSAARRRADALETLLDLAARGGETSSAPHTQVLLTIPAAAPTLASLEFMGTITPATLRRLSCDCSVTPIIVDGENVPLDVGRDKRLFPAHLRKALYVRDHGCIKCGAPAGWSHAHHIRHFADGGDTSLDNGCLLCPSCHADIHHNGWDVIMGADKHPWLIPPDTVDPQRRPLRAHNRRRLTNDSLSAAA